MYTKLYITREDAKKVFSELGNKPLRPGQAGVVTLGTFDEHFAEYGQTGIRPLGASLRESKKDGLFVLEFDHYLPSVPERLVELEVTVVRVEIVRMNSAPTKARAGYYEDPKTGFSAIVEHVFPSFSGSSPKGVSVYVQNMFLSARSLGAAQEANTKLSCGDWNRFLVNAFE